MTPPADPPVDWGPLERFCELAAARGIIGLDPDDFMWMGRHTSPAGVPVEVYKHIDTRRQLNLDARGHAYRWQRVDHSYQLTPLHKALSQLLEKVPSIAADIAARWSTTEPRVPMTRRPAPDVSL